MFPSRFANTDVKLFAASKYGFQQLHADTHIHFIHKKLSSDTTKDCQYPNSKVEKWSTSSKIFMPENLVVKIFIRSVVPVSI